MTETDLKRLRRCVALAREALAEELRDQGVRKRGSFSSLTAPPALAP